MKNNLYLSPQPLLIKTALLGFLILFSSHQVLAMPSISCDTIKISGQSSVSLNGSGDKLAVQNPNSPVIIYDTKTLKGVPLVDVGPTPSNLPVWSSDGKYLLLTKKLSNDFKVDICKISSLTMNGYSCQNTIEIKNISDLPNGVQYSSKLNILSFLTRTTGLDSPSGVGQKLTIVDTLNQSNRKSIILKNFEDNETFNTVGLNEESGNLIIGGEYGLSLISLSRFETGIDLKETVVTDLDSSFTVSSNLDRIFFGSLSKVVGSFITATGKFGWFKNVTRGISAIAFNQSELIATVTSKTGAELAISRAVDGEELPDSKITIPKFRGRGISLLSENPLVVVAGREDLIGNVIKVFNWKTKQLVASANLGKDPLVSERPYSFKNGGKLVVGRFSESVWLCTVSPM